MEWPAEKTTRTIGDGLRTQSLGVINFAHILRHVDGIVTVTEDEILAALRVILTATKLVAEPSGAVTLAAALFHAHELPKARKVAVILSGETWSLLCASVWNVRWRRQQRFKRFRSVSDGSSNLAW